jgi:hypothetical protein
LSIIRILPKAVVQVKKAIQGGAFTFQMFFHGKREDSPEKYSNSFSLQTYYYELGTTTFCLSLG